MLSVQLLRLVLPGDELLVSEQEGLDRRWPSGRLGFRYYPDLFGKGFSMHGT